MKRDKENQKNRKMKNNYEKEKKRIKKKKQKRKMRMKMKRKMMKKESWRKKKRKGELEWNLIFQQLRAPKGPKELVRMKKTRKQKQWIVRKSQEEKRVVAELMKRRQWRRTKKMKTKLMQLEATRA